MKGFFFAKAEFLLCCTGIAEVYCTRQKIMNFAPPGHLGGGERVHLGGGITSWFSPPKFDGAFIVKLLKLPMEKREMERRTASQIDWTPFPWREKKITEWFTSALQKKRRCQLTAAAATKKSALLVFGMWSSTLCCCCCCCCNSSLNDEWRHLVVLDAFAKNAAVSSTVNSRKKRKDKPAIYVCILIIF